jgi:flagellar hook-length control protein FliK
MSETSSRSQPSSGSAASGASGASQTKATAQPAPGAGDFAATLAQSLAAAPAAQATQAAPAAQAVQAATSDGSVAKASDESGAAGPSARPAKHSAADPDPAANVLALLENALAGALAATPAVAAAANAAATATGSISPQSGQSTVPQSAPASAGSQLIQTLAADAKASASTPASTAGTSAAPPAAAPSAGTAGAAAAALTAAQLTAASHVVSQQATSDSRSMTLSSPVGSSAWTDELGTKVTWMANQGIQSASLQLSPEHLGPLQVSISVHNGQASVWFGAAQPDTRAALQQSLPQLRQLFANQGLTLADAGVSRESPRGQGQQTPARGAAAVSGIAAASLDGSAGDAQVSSGLGLVDTYV